ncbi:dephospho-CoA kinase [Metallumcola ferriviriculae]|uniref:Dephospho-CoA kinase n=1 Tax=Metallumcola ferriviriculae TaxID=3039180 RepID=A0AAU0ULA9_9FIRM|nr:dephospho-CoA kinase [Desulfitibacteraceae bacterium MK1]
MIIGLTGGIGAGKSLVSWRLGQLGAYILDADVIARQVVEPGRRAYYQIVERFGRGVLNSDGAIDRKALAEVVFTDPAAREDLEAIIHPQVRKTTDNLAEAFLLDNPAGVIVNDAPLLIEAGMHRRVDQVWVVTADEDQRLNRVSKRDRTSREHVKQRMAAQLSQKERVKYADVIIDNSGSREETISQVDQLWRKICNGDLKK